MIVFRLYLYGHVKAKSSQRMNNLGPVAMTRAYKAVAHYGASASRDDAFAVMFVAFFFTAFNVQVDSTIIPLLIVSVYCVFLLKYHRHLLSLLQKVKILSLFPIWVMLSVIWSAIPGATVWYGLQLLITITTGMLVGASFTQRQLIRGIFVAMVIVTIASLISGQEGPSAVGPVLIGVTGSKDSMGFVGATLFSAGLAVLFDKQQPRNFRIFSFPFIPLGAYIASSVEAATSTLAVIACAVVFFSVLGFRYINRKFRILSVIFALMFAIPLGSIIYISTFGASTEPILSALNKDRTLTGRTLLWEKADEWIEQSPTLGHGYKAFWLGESIESVATLRNFGLTDGRTFQFHNTYREILVDLGWVGLLAFLSGGIVFLYCTISNAITFPSASSGFIVSVFLLCVARSPIESIVLVFYSYTALFYACGTAALVEFFSRARPISTRRADPRQIARQV
jgi:exopolysaccharide production protein ExoQ